MCSKFSIAKFVFIHCLKCCQGSYGRKKQACNSSCQTGYYSEKNSNMAGQWFYCSLSQDAFFRELIKHIITSDKLIIYPLFF